MAVQSPAPDSRPGENPADAECFPNERSHDAVSLAGTDFPRRLASLMREHGVVPEDITRESQVPVGTIMSILRGNKPTTRVKTIRRLARHFHMTPQELLGRPPRRVRARGPVGSAFLAVGAVGLIAAAVVAWPRIVPGEPAVVADGSRVVVSQSGREAPLWVREFEGRVSRVERVPWDRDQVLVGTDAAEAVPAAVSLFDYRTGERIWSQPLDREGPHAFAFAGIEGDGGQTVLAFFSTETDHVRAIRIFTRSGESRGSFVADPEVRPGPSSSEMGH